MECKKTAKQQQKHYQGIVNYYRSALQLELRLRNCIDEEKAEADTLNYLKDSFYKCKYDWQSLKDCVKHARQLVAMEYSNPPQPQQPYALRSPIFQTVTAPSTSATQPISQIRPLSIVLTTLHSMPTPRFGGKPISMSTQPQSPSEKSSQYSPVSSDNENDSVNKNADSKKDDETDETRKVNKTKRIKQKHSSVTNKQVKVMIRCLKKCLHMKSVDELHRELTNVQTNIDNILKNLEQEKQRQNDIKWLDNIKDQYETLLQQANTIELDNITLDRLGIPTLKENHIEAVNNLRTIITMCEESSVEIASSVLVEEPGEEMTE